MKKNLGIIIVAAGKSSRYGRNKLLEYIGGHPVFIYPLINFRGTCPDENIVLVCHPDFINKYKELSEKYIPDNKFKFVDGGAERYNSVINGLEALSKQVKYVAIHDAARPLANKNLLWNCLGSCEKNGSGVAAKKIHDTVKSADADGKVIKNIDRSTLWCVETPQVFLKEQLAFAYHKVIDDGIDVTDDAGAMKHAGYPVYLVENPDLNPKITHQSDLNYIKITQPSRGMRNW